MPIMVSLRLTMIGMCYLTLEIIRQIAHAYHGESKTDTLVLN